MAHNLRVARDKLVHVQCLANSLVIRVGIKACCSCFFLKCARHGVIVQAEAVHVVARNAHDLFCPVVIVGDARAAGNAEHVVVAVIADVGLEAAVEVGIIGRAHIAAAAPVFVADTEVFHLPRLGMTVFGAQVRHGRNAIKRHVLHPLAHFLHGAGAHVAVDVRLAADLTAEF